MNAAQIKVAVAGLFFLGIFLSGFWLNHSGKPYGLLIFTLHKLVALGAVIFLGLTVYRFQQVYPLNALQIGVLALTAVQFLITIATGGMLSVEKAMPALVLRLHQVAPFLTVLSAGGSLYLLLFSAAGLVKI